MIKFSKNIMLDYSFTEIGTIKIFTQEDLPRGESIDKPIWERVVKNGDGIITKFLEDIGRTINGYNVSSAVTSIGNKKISFVNHSDPEKMMLNTSEIFDDGINQKLGMLVNIEHWLDKRKFELMRETWEKWESYEGNETRTLNARDQKGRPLSTVDRLDNAVIIPYHLQRHAMTGKRLDFNELVKWYCTAKESERNKVMSTIRVLCYDPELANVSETINGNFISSISKAAKVGDN